MVPAIATNIPAPAAVGSSGGAQGRGAAAIRVTPYLTVVDREQAIERAVREAGPGDVVLIAGKGHEKYQVIGERTLAFDDVEVAKTALKRRRSSGARAS